MLHLQTLTKNILRFLNRFMNQVMRLKDKSNIKYLILMMLYQYNNIV